MTKAQKILRVRYFCNVPYQAVYTFRTFVVGAGLVSVVIALLLGVFLTQEIALVFTEVKIFIYAIGVLLTTAVCGRIISLISKSSRLVSTLELRECKKSK